MTQTVRYGTDDERFVHSIACPVRQCVPTYILPAMPRIMHASYATYVCIT